MSSGPGVSKPRNEGHPNRQVDRETYAQRKVRREKFAADVAGSSGYGKGLTREMQRRVVYDEGEGDYD